MSIEPVQLLHGRHAILYPSGSSQGQGQAVPRVRILRFKEGGLLTRGNCLMKMVLLVVYGA